MISPDPTVVPAAEEKVYADLYLTHMRVVPNGEKDHRVTVTMQPYDYETDDILPAGQLTHVIPSLKVEAARVPLLAQAMGLMIIVAGLLVQEKALVEKIENETDPDTRVALEAHLVSVRAGLGFYEVSADSVVELTQAAQA
jgi:hypothetical protein